MMTPVKAVVAVVAIGVAVAAAGVLPLSAQAAGQQGQTGAAMPRIELTAGRSTVRRRTSTSPGSR